MAASVGPFHPPPRSVPFAAAAAGHGYIIWVGGKEEEEEEEEAKMSVPQKCRRIFFGVMYGEYVFVPLISLSLFPRFCLIYPTVSSPPMEEEKKKIPNTICEI